MFVLKEFKVVNFKSLKNLKLHDLRKINLFIGKPNTGKSNILEALSLPAADAYVLERFVRFQNRPELFYLAHTEKEIIAKFSGIIRPVDRNDKKSQKTEFSLKMSFENENISFYFEGDLRFKEMFKFYKFSKTTFFRKDDGKKVLSVPYGDNLFSVLTLNNDLRAEINGILQDYDGINFSLDKINKKIGVAFLEEGSFVIIPFSSLAESLQRLIFFKAAIKTNKNSIIILEEPEAHLYPPYILNLIADVKSSENQYFITTHNPYVINEFLKEKNSAENVAVYIVDYQEKQTFVKRLSDSDLQELWQSGADMFLIIDDLFKII